MRDHRSDLQVFLDRPTRRPWRRRFAYSLLGATFVVAQVWAHQPDGSIEVRAHQRIEAPGVSSEKTVLATVVILTTASGSSWSIPADCNLADSVELVGAGGGGNSSGTGGSRAAGGGGGYSRVNNLTLTPGGSLNIQVGVGGASTTGTTGNNGTDTWVNKSAASAPGSTTDGGLAKAGAGGTTGSGGQGGQAASGVGDVKYNGGNGFLGGANGGGGAAGPAGAGGNGSATAGGSANNATTAGPTTTAAGNSGTEWTTHGCGTGAFRDSGTTGNAGGNYGGGGSGANGGASGAGANGLIVITYTPVVAVGRSWGAIIG